MDVFFYGTLLDSDVRHLVLGAEAARIALVPARLPGYRRMAKLRSSAPVLVARPGATTEGLLARGLTASQLARLSHYEGAQYRLQPCRVRGEDGAALRALVYLGRGRIPVRRAPWRLAAWQRRHKRGFLRVMALWIAAYREAAYRPPGLGRGIKRWAARG